MNQIVVLIKQGGSWTRIQVEYKGKKDRCIYSMEIILTIRVNYAVLCCVVSRIPSKFEKEGM
jgi:hypothetical protein